MVTAYTTTPVDAKLLGNDYIKIATWKIASQHYNIIKTIVTQLTMPYK